MSDFGEHIKCKWCRGDNPPSASTCERCGAPLDVRDTATDSGWREAPRLRDLTTIQCGATTIQLDGTVVPVAEATVGEGDSLFFEHHAMLWKDYNMRMSLRETPGGVNRILAGMPFVVSEAFGPGRVSFSRDAPGELVILPVDAGMEIDVREHAMLAATGNLSYTYEKMQGVRAAISAGTGMFLDRFVAQQGQGLLILHGYGNVLQRTLADGEVIEVEPGGFLYRDSSVTMEVDTISLTPEDGGAKQVMKGLAGRGLAAIKAARQLQKEGLSAGGLQAAAGTIGGTWKMTLMKMRGPGRVGIQSMYQQFETA